MFGRCLFRNSGRTQFLNTSVSLCYSFYNAFARCVFFPARFLTEGIRNEYVEEKVLQAKNFKYTWTNAAGFSHTPTAEAGNML